MAGSQGKKSKKAGKKKLPCQTYRNTNQREKNKVKRLEKHLKHKQPGDPVALAAIEKCKKAIRGF